MKIERTTDWESYLLTLKRKKRKLSIVLFVFMILVMVIYNQVLQGKNYMLIGSILLMGVLFLVFFHFDRQRTRAREVVLLSTMTGFSVGLNELCAHTIPLHAGTAMIVISGIGLGPEAGFLIGALARFICNFFDGQGPWTPWQMIAWGMIGYLSGLFFNKIEYQKKEGQTLAKRLSLAKEQGFSFVIAPVIMVLASWIVIYLYTICFGNGDIPYYLCYIVGCLAFFLSFLLIRKKLPANMFTTTIFTFFVVFLLYGGIMNLAAFFMNYQMDAAESPLTFENLKLLYLSGAPYDFSHAVSAALCVFLLGDPLLQKLARIQIKYGIRWF